MDTFTLSSFITICFVIFKFTELKISNKDLIPIKELFKESFIVFIACLAGFFITEQFYTTTNTSSIPSVFTGNPDF